MKINWTSGDFSVTTKIFKIKPVNWTPGEWPVSNGDEGLGVRGVAVTPIES